MPPPRTWLPRIEEILGVLRASRISFWDRPSIENLFQIQRRTALLLMKEVGPEKRHGGSVVRRPDLLSWVEKIDRTEGQEVQRRRNVVEKLDQEVAQYKAARRALESEGKPPTEFTLPREMLTTFITSLPDGIEINPGEIRVTFDPASPTEALQKLYLLSLALANDEAGFLSSQKKGPAACHATASATGRATSDATRPATCDATGKPA